MEVNECPQCGAPANGSAKSCDYCKAEFFVTSIAYLSNFDTNGISKYMKHYKELTREEPDNTEGFLGLGLCYLQMGTYPLAQKYFEQVIDLSPEISQAYYYFALANVRGRRLKILPLKEVRKIENYLETAIQLDENSSHYKLLLAMLKRDYYESNGMKISPPGPDDLLAELHGQDVHSSEFSRMKEAVKVEDVETYVRGLNLI